MDTSNQYRVRVAPGCAPEKDRLTISRHRTLRAAVARARKSDRLVVEIDDTDAILYRALSRQPTSLGYGSYGGGDIRPLKACLEVAENALAEYRR